MTLIRASFRERTGVMSRMYGFIAAIVFFLLHDSLSLLVKDGSNITGFDTTTGSSFKSRLGVLTASLDNGNSSILKPSTAIRTLQGLALGQDCKSVHRFCEYPSFEGPKDRFTCSCSRSCSMYGDCCLDAVPSKMTSLECARINLDLRPAVSLAMISKCREDDFHQTGKMPEQSKFIRDLCEKASNDSTVDENLPVSSSTSQLTFKNFYCALCNDVPISDLRFWSLNAKCILPDNVSLDQALQRCKFRISSPSEISSPPICDGQVTGKCPTPYGPSTTRRKCEQYYAPVVDPADDRIVFKNRFCAVCHGLPQIRVRCSNGSEKPVSMVVNPLLSSSLSLLLDVDSGQNFGETVGSTSKCPEGFQALTWKTSCSTCKQQQSRFLRCFPIQTPSPNNSLNCYEHEVHIRVETPFNIDPKQRLVFLDSNESYIKGQYKLLSHNSVIICASSHPSKYLKFSYSQRVLTVVCLSISVVCLVTKIILLVLQRPLSVARCLLVCLCFSLLASHLLSLVSNEGWSRPVCTVLAVLNHYAQLMSLTWNLMLAMDIRRTFLNSLERYSADSSRLRMYVLRAVLVPAIPVSLACVIEFASDWERLRPLYGPDLCWLNNRNALLVFFAFPLGLLFLMNCYLLVSSGCRIAITIKSTKTARNDTNEFWKKDVTRLILYVKLAVLMGLTWAFGLVAAYGRNEVLWYLFIIGHGLQGACLLISFTKCRRSKVFCIEPKRKTSSVNDLRDL